MCYVFLFFDLLLAYFFLLLFLTLSRNEVTYNGIFYAFSIYLMFIVCYLISIFDDMLFNNSLSESFFSLNSNNWFSIEIGLHLSFDMLSYFFILLVCVIGLGTNLYTVTYMNYEAHEDVFALLINWFIFSMIILVLASNLFTLFLGWESIGLSSFFLINFWNTSSGTVKSSFKAFFFNKISDLFLFVFLVLIHCSYQINDLNVLNSNISLNLVVIDQISYSAVLCLFLCTMFNSAQIIAHLWLPDSMEAPVPASALIHSATLVSAGIYLLLSFTPLLTLYNFHEISLIIGSITAAYGGIVSSSQTDMNKLLAYSTISHCGFLFVSIGTEVYSTAVVYLFLHGIFNALTFFCAGSFIRVSGSQDTSFMGGLNSVMPVETTLLIICAFNLGGLPFSLGYLYNSMLTASVLVATTNYVCLSLCTIGMLSGLVYTFSLVYYSAFDVPKDFFASVFYELQQKRVNVVLYWSTSSPVLILAVSILLIFAIWIYINFQTHFVNSNLTIFNSPILLNPNPEFISSTNLFYNNFYETFYSLYLLLIVVIISIGWRIEFTFVQNLNTLASLVIVVFFIIIYSNII